MNFRPLLAVRPMLAGGLGLAAAVSLGAATTPVFAATSGNEPAVNVLGVQASDLADLTGIQVPLQAGAGQLGVIDPNVNAPIRVISEGDNGATQQSTAAQGTAANTLVANQRAANGGDESLLNLLGVQAADLADLTGTQILPQIGAGQLGVVGANVNAPIRIASAGNNGPVSQTGTAEGTASNRAWANQQATGDSGDGMANALGAQLGDLIGLTGTQVPVQAGAGQVGVLQGNVNAPISVLSEGDNGSTTQATDSSGSATNQAWVNQYVIG